MKKGNQLLLLMLLGFSCSPERLDDCVLREAVISYPGPGSATEKRLYFSDGPDRLQIHGFYPDNDGVFLENPDWVRALNYVQGKVVLDITTHPGQPEYNHRFEFSYLEEEITIISIHETEINNEGDVVVDTVYQDHFIESPGSATYLTSNEAGEDILEVYEDGNLTRIGFRSPIGTHQAYDTTWIFPIAYRYDHKPNASKNNVAIQHLIFAPNNGFCRNNMIEEILGADSADPISHKQSFQMAGSILTTWTFESTGRTVSLNYNCN